MSFTCNIFVTTKVGKYFGFAQEGKGYNNKKSHCFHSDFCSPSWT